MIYLLFLTGGKGIYQRAYWNKWRGGEKSIIFIEHVEHHEDPEPGWVPAHLEQYGAWGHWYTIDAEIKLLFFALRSRHETDENDVFYLVSGDTVPLLPCSEFVKSLHVTVFASPGYKKEDDKVTKSACKNLLTGNFNQKDFLHLLHRFKHPQWFCVTRKDGEAIIDVLLNNEIPFADLEIAWNMNKFVLRDQTYTPNEFVPLAALVCSGRTDWKYSMTIANLRPTKGFPSPLEWNAVNEKKTFQYSGYYIRADLDGVLSWAYIQSRKLFPTIKFFRKVGPRAKMNEMWLDPATTQALKEVRLDKSTWFLWFKEGFTWGSLEVVDQPDPVEDEEPQFSRVQELIRNDFLSILKKEVRQRIRRDFKKLRSKIIPEKRGRSLPRSSSKRGIGVS